MPLDVVLRFQDAQFPLPPSAPYVEPEPLRLKHPVVRTLPHTVMLTASCARRLLRTPAAWQTYLISLCSN